MLFRSWEGLNFSLQALSPGFPRWGGGLLGPLSAAGLPGPEAGREPGGGWAGAPVSAGSERPARVKVTVPWRGGGRALLLGSAGPACARAPPPSRPASERYPPPLPGETRRPVTQQQAWPNQARGPPRPRPPLPTACPMPGGQSRPGSRRRRARSLAAAAPARPNLGEPSAQRAGSRAPGSCQVHCLQACGRLG